MEQNKEFDIDRLDVFSVEEKKYINSIVVEFPKQGVIPGHYIRSSYQYSINIYDKFIETLNGTDTKSKVDFIYVKGFSGWKLLEEKKKGGKFPPIGIKFHGYEMFQRSPSLLAFLQRYILRPPVAYNSRNADIVFSYGGKITEIIRNIGVVNHKIIELPSGISRGWLNSEINVRKGIRKFLFIGRYERRKGIKELIYAIENIQNEYNFEFHFIGPLPEKFRVSSSKMIYWGKITDTNILKSIYSKCDVLVCPSYSEGMPNVILEGMAQGLAVIATNVGAVNMLVSDKTGWMIESCNVNDIELSIIAAITCEDEELNEKKKNAQLLIKRDFLWKNIITDLISKIKEIISE